MTAKPSESASETAPSDAQRADIEALRRLATASVLLAIVVALLSSPAYFAAFNWDLEAAIFGDPAEILGGGAAAATQLRWGAIGDMFYSYLLLVPLALFLHRRLRPRKPWLADLGTAGAFAYIFVGAAGAAILANVGSSLIDAYAAAGTAERVSIGISFDALRNLVYFALWQTLDPITAGIWVLSVGWLILPDQRVVGRLLVVLGTGLFGLSLMTMLGIHSLAVLLVGLAAILAVWAGWILVDRVQGPKATAGVP